MYIASQVGGWSTTEIGKFYNGRDHSTVCYAITHIKTLWREVVVGAEKSLLPQCVLKSGVDSVLKLDRAAKLQSNDETDEEASR